MNSQAQTYDDTHICQIFQKWTTSAQSHMTHRITIRFEANDTYGYLNKSIPNNRTFRSLASEAGLMDTISGG